MVMQNAKLSLTELEPVSIGTDPCFLIAASAFTETVTVANKMASPARTGLRRHRRTFSAIKLRIVKSELQDFVMGCKGFVRRGN